MVGRKNLTFVFTVILTACFVSGCACIPVPSSDSVPPLVTLTVIFDDLSGNEVTQYVNTTGRTLPISIQVPAGKQFTIFYGATDDGGIKSMLHDYKYYKRLNGLGQVIQPLLVPDDFSNCPKTYRAVNKEYPWQNENRQYEFQVTAADFHNNRSTTPKITVRHGQ